MILLKNKFKTFTDAVYELFKIAELQIYFSKYSNKLYTNYQKLWLLIYKQYRGLTYEGLIEDLHSNTELRQYLSINVVPHYTTLIKFGQQLPQSIFDALFVAFCKQQETATKVAIDATGFSLDNASKHYCKRVGIPYQKRPFMKASFVVDVEKLTILFVKLRKIPRHDVLDAKPLLRKANEHGDLREIYADRGYDSEEIFSFIANETEAYPSILQRNIVNKSVKRKGFFRKRYFTTFDYGAHTTRALIETTNSMVKRRFGSNVLAKTTKMQKIEIFCRIIAYNIDRAMRNAERMLLRIVVILRVSY